MKQSVIKQYHENYVKTFMKTARNKLKPVMLNLVLYKMQKQETLSSYLECYQNGR